MTGQPPDVTGITCGFRTGKGKLDPMEHELPAAAIVLGAYLKALHVSAGLSGREAGARITRKLVTIRNIEEGLVRRKVDVLGLLRHYGVEDRRTVKSIKDLFQTPQQHVLYDDAPGRVDRLRACLRLADSLFVYSGYRVPDFAQIAVYPADDLEQFHRADELSRVPPTPPLTEESGHGTTLLLDESVLMRSLRHPAEMAEQMAHLQRLHASHDGPEIGVVPRRGPVAPFAPHMYGMSINGREMFVGEWPGFAVYQMGADAEPWRRGKQAALAFALSAEETGELLARARSEFEQSAASHEEKSVLSNSIREGRCSSECS